MDDEKELATLVTRGFAGMSDQLRERDREIQELSKNVIRMEGDLKAVNATINRITDEMSRAENEGVKVRVITLENSLKDMKAALESNAVWLRALLISVILLLMGVLFNFINARAK